MENGGKHAKTMALLTAIAWTVVTVLWAMRVSSGETAYGAEHVIDVILMVLFAAGAALYWHRWFKLDA